MLMLCVELLCCCRALEVLSCLIVRVACWAALRVVSSPRSASYDGLLAERDRLRAARAALTGEGPAPQISQDDVAAYLAAHPGSRAGVIAKALGVPLARVSSHLYRGKHTRFVSRDDGWHLRDQPKQAAKHGAGRRGK
jgi:hypothetical protein